MRRGRDGPGAQPQRRPGDARLFPKKVTGAVLDALSDHEKLSMPLLEDEETGRQFALLILKLLAGRSAWNVQPGK